MSINKKPRYLAGLDVVKLILLQKNHLLYLPELAPHIPLMIECLKKLKKQESKTTNQKGTPTEKRVL
jgi:hypothetical protein